MHLHSIELTNFRQFKEKKFDFKPGFNLLVGENGAGKTTILRGVRAVLGVSRSKIKGVKIEDSDVSLREDFLEIHTEIHSTYNIPSHFGFLKLLGGGEGEKSGRKKRPLTLFYPSNEAISPAMRAKPIARGMETPQYSSRSAEEYLYSAERNFLEKQNTSNESRFGDSRSVRNFVSKILSKFSSDMGEFYWRFTPYDCAIIVPKEMEENNALDEKLKRTVRSFAIRWLEEEEAFRDKPFIWPDVSKFILSNEMPKENMNGELPHLYFLWDEMAKRLDISSDDYKKISYCSLEVRLTPRIMIRRQSGIMNLDQLSDGEKRLFMLFVDIARQLSIRKEFTNNKFGAGEAIVLIDEIDVHLHPKWQRLIVPALEELFPNCQFIATTHSPFVIQATSRDKIIAIDSENIEIPLDGGNSIEDIAENIQGITAPQRSIRAEKLSYAAKEYFKLLEIHSENPDNVSDSDLRKAELEYREASEPFTSDPAVHALLKMLAEEGCNK